MTGALSEQKVKESDKSPETLFIEDSESRQPNIETKSEDYSKPAKKKEKVVDPGLGGGFGAFNYIFEELTDSVTTEDEKVDEKAKKNQQAFVASMLRRNPENRSADEKNMLGMLNSIQKAQYATAYTKGFIEQAKAQEDLTKTYTDMLKRQYNYSNGDYDIDIPDDIKSQLKPEVYGALKDWLQLNPPELLQDPERKKNQSAHFASLAATMVADVLGGAFKGDKGIVAPDITTVGTAQTAQAMMMDEKEFDAVKRSVADKNFAIMQQYRGDMVGAMRAYSVELNVSERSYMIELNKAFTREYTTMQNILGRKDAAISAKGAADIGKDTLKTDVSKYNAGQRQRAIATTKATQATLLAARMKQKNIATYTFDEKVVGQMRGALDSTGIAHGNDLKTAMEAVLDSTDVAAVKKMYGNIDKMLGYYAKGLHDAVMRLPHKSRANVSSLMSMLMSKGYFVKPDMIDQIISKGDLNINFIHENDDGTISFNEKQVGIVLNGDIHEKLRKGNLSAGANGIGDLGAAFGDIAGLHYMMMVGGTANGIVKRTLAEREKGKGVDIAKSAKEASR